MDLLLLLVLRLFLFMATAPLTTEEPEPEPGTNCPAWYELKLYHQATIQRRPGTVSKFDCIG